MMATAPGKRSRPWQLVDLRRETSTERGYTFAWAQASRLYRRENPLCIACLLRARTTAATCVDHIIPAACCPDLFWDRFNWQSLCRRCHSFKTSKEPRHAWTPDAEKMVVCGIPGTGKTTFARDRGAPYFSADELGLTSAASIVRARSDWCDRGRRGPWTVIVASPLSASRLAGQFGGIVHHLTERHVD